MTKTIIQQTGVGAVSDVGRVRKQNEDAFFVDDKHGLFIVSDGMGGANAGEVASKIVVSILPKMIRARLAKLKQPRSRAIRYWLRREILALSQHLHAESAKQVGTTGMGATLVLALVRGNQVHIAHMGDSRAYLFREGNLTQITEDHSVVALLLKGGDITQEEAKVHPARSILTRNIGMESEMPPDVRTVDLKPSDRLLLCTDGLTGMLTVEEIAAILKDNPDPHDACKALVAAANHTGGKDNITVVLVNWS